MSNLIPYHMPGLPRPRKPDPAAPAPSAWERLPADKRAVALARYQIVAAALARVRPGVSERAAVEYVLRAVTLGQVDGQLKSAAEQLARGGDCPSRATVQRWIKAHRSGGLPALAPGYRGSVRKTYGWELRAMSLYHIPSQPSYAAVAAQLRDEGFVDASDDRVRSYLKSMPETHGSHSPLRVGTHYYRQNIGRYRSRDTSCLLVGELYQMDGHTVDVYLRHPFSGGIWRAELTAVMDLATRYIVGWYITESESSRTTQLALGHALLTWDHVCALLHVDVGSGFKAKLMSDEANGFYARFGITPMFALPGNAKGKGNIERWFRTLRDQHDKLFMGGEWYCGDDMASEINRRLHDQIKQGKRRLPTLGEYRDSLTRWIDRYNNTPHSALDGRTPAELWATLERVPLELPEAALVRERQARVVRRSTLILDNRTYSHADLAMYERRLLPVEYSIHDDTHVWVYDEQDRLLCVAELKSKQDYLPASRLEEARAKRREGQLKRLARKVAEVEAQHRPALSHDQALVQLEQLSGPPAAPALEHQPAGPAIDLVGSVLDAERRKDKGASPVRLTPFDWDQE